MPHSYGTAEWREAYRRLTTRRQESEPKPYIMGTPEWADCYEKAVRQDAEYKAAAEKWEGALVAHFLADPGIGLDADLCLFMDLWHGNCRSIHLAPREEMERAPFVITGDYRNWKSVVSGRVDVIKAMMEGKLSLAGDLGALMEYGVPAAVRLVTLAPEARFLSRMTSADIAAFRDAFNPARAECGF